MRIDHERLPCGTELASLVLEVADGQPPADRLHEEGCPYCQAALRDVRQGWGEVEALIREAVPIPAGLTAQIMAAVRALARRAADSVLLGLPRGETRISHGVVGQTIQRLAAAVPGVVFASAKPLAHEPPEPGRLSVAIRLVVAFGPAIDTLADAVRQVVDRRIPRLTGAELGRIDITVVDVAEVPD